jgi:tRNA nucleotidyltransferase (CCA-adding enzyme)
MSRNIHTVTELTPVHEVCHVMCERNIHRVPVLRDGKVVGLVTAMDVVRTVAGGGQVE